MRERISIAVPTNTEAERNASRVRSLRTVRISVTPKCDLDCLYCNVDKKAPASQNLSAREIVLIAEAAAMAGARTVRLTGGEPLLRDDIEEIVARIRATGLVGEIALTTNARRLSSRAQALRDSGLDRVNIGLPSLREETYHQVTKGDLESALAGLDAAISAGLAPTKVNVVVMRNMNGDEIGAFVELAREKPIDVRFIELMPFSGSDSMMPAAEVRSVIASALGADMVGSSEQSPTSEFCRPEGFAGSLGVIAPLTEPFCNRCDRLRVTADGRLRSCLSEPGETDLRAMLDEGASAEAIADAMRTEFSRKPVRHKATFHGSMRGIGG